MRYGDRAVIGILESSMVILIQLQLIDRINCLVTSFQGGKWVFVHCDVAMAHVETHAEGREQDDFAHYRCFLNIAIVLYQEIGRDMP
jgi:hypothetical protein